MLWLSVKILGRHQIFHFCVLWSLKDWKYHWEINEWLHSLSRRKGLLDYLFYYFFFISSDSLPFFIYMYIYIYIYRLPSRFRVWPPIEFCDSFPFYPFLGFMPTKITFQPSKTAVNFTTDWALSITLAHMNVMVHNCRIDMLAHMGLWPANVKQFSTYFTVDAITLLNWCLSLFTLMSWSFVIHILNTIVLEGVYAYVNYFEPLISVKCHFSRWGTDMLNFYRVLIFFSSLHTFHPFHRKTVALEGDCHPFEWHDQPN